MNAVKPNFFRLPNKNHPLMRDARMDLLLDNFRVRDVLGVVPDSQISISGSGFELKLGSEGRSLLYPRTASHQVDILDNVTGWEFPGGLVEFSMLYYFTHAGPDDADEYTIGSNSTTLGPTTDVSGVYDVEDGKPHMLLVTRDANIAVSYIDGVQLTSQGSPGANENLTYLFRYRADSNTWNLWLSDTTGQTDSMIGGTPQKTTDRWGGQIHRVVHFGRALSAIEAKETWENPWFGYEDRAQSIGLSVAAAAGDVTGFPAHMINKTNIVRSRHV